MSTNEARPNTLKMLNIEVESQLMKLSAWVQTFSFVLDGLEDAGVAAEGGANITGSLNLAGRYPVFSEMLFLILGGLQDCAEVLNGLHEREHKLLQS